MRFGKNTGLNFNPTFLPVIISFRTNVIYTTCEV